ncbi:hypothetical protein F511_07942 [Dorcoceras hygrometricum]|uniref:Uncharacterized protein n=1 Tax=Dorcoceras hygrometricum TaxID=472368 RepID=A0A2Z7AE02_9LAMI|nr:hypothetical protein F511_07942 [Dorcoceras hygrometricum]
MFFDCPEVRLGSSHPSSSMNDTRWVEIERLDCKLLVLHVKGMGSTHDSTSCIARLRYCMFYMLAGFMEALRTEAEVEVEDVTKMIGEMDLVLARFQRMNPPMFTGAERGLMAKGWVTVTSVGKSGIWLERVHRRGNNPLISHSKVQLVVLRRDRNLSLSPNDQDSNHENRLGLEDLLDLSFWDRIKLK